MSVTMAVARGLAFLHHGCRPPQPHGGLHPGNVLLPSAAASAAASGPAAKHAATAAGGRGEEAVWQAGEGACVADAQMTRLAFDGLPVHVSAQSAAGYAAPGERQGGRRGGGCVVVPSLHASATLRTAFKLAVQILV